MDTEERSIPPDCGLDEPGGDVADLRDTVAHTPMPTDLGPFFRSAPVLTCLATPDGYLPQVGGPWTETLGWSTAEFTSRRFFDFVHPDDLESTAAALGELNAGHTVTAFVNRYRTADGGWRYLRWHAQPVDDGSGNVYAIAADVTREVEQERALEMHATLLEVLAEFQQRAIGSGLTELPVEWLVDTLRTLVGAEEALVGVVGGSTDSGPVVGALAATATFAATLTTLTAEEVDGLDFALAPTGVLRDLNTLVGAVVRTGDAVISNDAATDARRSPVAGRDPDVANFAAVPLLGSSGVVGVLALAGRTEGFDEDVVRFLSPLAAALGAVVEQAVLRRRQERTEEQMGKLSTLFAAVARDVDAMLMVTGVDGTIRFLNPAAERMLGVTSDAVAGVMSPAAFIGAPADDPSGARLPWIDAYESWLDDESHEPAEWTFVGADGTGVPLLVNATALRAEDGTVEGWAHLGTSLVERRQIEEVRTRAAVLASENATLRERERELGLLAEATEYVMSSTSTRDALDVVRGYAPTILGTDELDVIPVATTARGADPADDTLRATVRSTDCWALRTGRPHLTAAGQSTRCRHLVGGSTYLCVPMSDGERTVAVLSARLDGHPDGVRDAAGRIEDVARQMGVALSNLNLRRSLERLATIDHLTGVGNLRVKDDAMRRAVSACRTRGEQFGLLMIDIDHFKEINDEFGYHEGGDRVLREVAATLRDSVREGDSVVRRGGDEFVVVLRDVAPGATERVAESLRARIADHVEVGPGRRCTVSVGGLEVARADASPARLLATADAALYEVKRSGRNAVRMASEDDARVADGPTALAPTHRPDEGTTVP